MPIDHDEQPRDAWGAPLARRRKKAPPTPTLDLTVGVSPAPPSTDVTAVETPKRDGEPVPDATHAVAEAARLEQAPKPATAAMDESPATTRAKPVPLDDDVTPAPPPLATVTAPPLVGDRPDGPSPEPTAKVVPDTPASTPATPVESDVAVDVRPVGEGSGEPTPPSARPDPKPVASPVGRDDRGARGEVAKSGTLSLTLPDETSRRYDELVDADPLGLAKMDLLVAWLPRAEQAAPGLVAELARLVPTDLDGRALVTPKLQAAPDETIVRITMWARGESRTRLDAAVAGLRDGLAMFEVTMAWTAAVAVEVAWADAHGLDTQSVQARVAHVTGRR